MKKLNTVAAGMFAAAAIAGTSCESHAESAPETAPGTNVSTVYFTQEITPESLVKIYKALGVEASGRVAVKISTGEDGGNNYLKPALIGKLVNDVNGTIVECNTAYAGSRYTTAAHLETIRKHGFNDIAKVDIMDADGDMQIPVKDKTHIKYDIVGAHLANYDFMINLAHFKGHAMGGFGGVLKNASIGVASATGKAYIHTAGKTQSPNELWSNLPAQDYFLESMASAAQGVHDHFGVGKIVYINVMNNMSVDCDCDSHPADPKLKDMGILASTDPVALDKACLDLVFNHKASDGDDEKPLVERINRQHGTHIVDYAEKIGLGSKTYKIIMVK
ncbi:MAG: DUF362 domain-containing protein [Candidatus Kapabacteria bacterium]|nr:DUF362 domain-containing protein [Candidatus Kapabacteria bacterium]